MAGSLRRALAAVSTTAALMAPFIPAAPAAAAEACPQARRSENLECIAVLPSTGGTDIEFFSRELTTYRDEAGTPVVSETPVTRHFAVVGNQETGAQFVDITNPEAPYEVARLVNCRLTQGDPQVNAEGTLLTIAGQGGSCTMPDGRKKTDGSAIIDLTDPYNPTPVAFAPNAFEGAHNNTLHPGGRYLYISSSALAPNSERTNTVIPIYDLADPRNPRLVKNWTVPGNGPHDIRFSDDGTRAYLAGISAFRIVNTENPEQPAVISTIVQPGGSIGHDTLVTRDKRFLFLGDEGGGGGPYACPGGAIAVYDLLDERAPLFLGVAEAGGGPVTDRQLDEAAAGEVDSCTSHVMSLNPNGTSLTIGWYGLGTRVFDFSSFYGPDGKAKTSAGIALAWGRYGVGLVESGYMIPGNADTWAAKQYAPVPGYIFSDDLRLGFYVTRIKQ